MATVRIKARVGTYGLRPGDDADLPNTGEYAALIFSGLFQLLGSTPLVNGSPALPVETPRVLGLGGAAFYTSGGGPVPSGPLGPAFISASTAPFTSGTAGSFTIITSGSPAPAITRTGTLPAGLSFVDHGDGTATLSGTPTTAGSYPLVLTAANGVPPNATQTLTVTVGAAGVNQAPTFTSAATTSFTSGTAGSFTVTTSGYPAAAISRTGALPAGLSFVDNGNGTATLSGTPSASGTFPLSLTAANGVAPNATQSLTVTVYPPSVPAVVTSVDATGAGPSAASSLGDVVIPRDGAWSVPTLRRLDGASINSAVPYIYPTTGPGGDLIVGGSGFGLLVLPKGAAGEVLTVDAGAGAVAGLNWLAPASSAVSGTAAQYPIIMASSISPTNIQAMAVASGGAVCNGSDDQVEIQNALDASITIADLTRYGRPVLLAPGTFFVNLVPNQPVGVWQSALTMGNGAELDGSGMLTSVIQFMANTGSATIDGGTDAAPASNNNYAITNNAGNGGSGNTDIQVADFSINGNSSGGQTNRHHHGIVWWNCNRVVHERVLVRNMRGTSGSTLGETFAYDAKAGANIDYYECRAEGKGVANILSAAGPTVGSTASGFSSNQGTNIRYVNCTAQGLGAMGFTCYQARNLLYSNCLARLNFSHGFNAEGSYDISYSSCIGGGASSPYSGNPWAANTNLGNGGHGFCISTARDISTGIDMPCDGVSIVGCHGSWNGVVGDPQSGKGLFINSGINVRVVGGTYRFNVNRGISISGGGSTGKVALLKPVIEQNPRGAGGDWANVEVSAYAYQRAVTGTGSPAVFATNYAFNGNWQEFAVAPLPGNGTAAPASGAITDNPFPWDCHVYLTFVSLTGAGVELVSPKGTTTGLGTAINDFVVPVGWSVRLWFTGSVPTTGSPAMYDANTLWKWHANS